MHNTTHTQVTTKYSYHWSSNEYVDISQDWKKIDITVYLLPFGKGGMFAGEEEVGEGVWMQINGYKL